MISVRNFSFCISCAQAFAVLMLANSLCCDDVLAAEATLLQKDQLFAVARKRLLAERWTPVIPNRRELEPIGTENYLLRNHISEFESCSVEGYCIFRYARRKQCLTLFTVGERLKDMKVTSWRFGCS